MKQKYIKIRKPANSITIGNGISMFETLFSKQLIPMHWHDFYEFEFILDGEGEIIYNDKTYPVKPGTLSFLTPLDFHEIHVSDKLHVICVQFSPESINKDILVNFQNIENPVYYCSKEETERTVTFFNLLRNNFISSSTKDEYISHVLESMLISFKSNFKASHANHEQSPTPVQKALIYIHSHFKENPKMSDVAKLLYLNENYFCSLFKEHIGESYKDYLRKLKLNHAKNLIVHSSISLTQIAFECGYSSQSNFNRDFKRFFNISPKDMRQKNIEK